jgi:CD109 antigen
VQVSLSLNTTQASPADGVSVQVTATPGSYVGLLAVDQSVLLLKNDNDLSTDAVSGILATHLQLQLV